MIIIWDILRYIIKYIPTYYSPIKSSICTTDMVDLVRFKFAMFPHSVDFMSDKLIIITYRKSLRYFDNAS